MQVNFDSAFRQPKNLRDLAVGGAKFQHRDDLILTQGQSLAEFGARERCFRDCRVIGSTRIPAEQIDCDFRRLDGYLFQALSTDSKIIDDELDAVRKIGAPVHRLVGCGQFSSP